MATWDPPSDAELDVDKPIKAVDIRRIRDLSQAMAEGASGAPSLGWLNVSSQEPTSSVSSLTWTGLSAYHELRVMGIWSGVGTPTSIDLQIRATAGTWRTISSSNAPSANVEQMFHGEVWNYDRVDGDVVVGKILAPEGTATLDRTGRAATGAYESSVGYSTYAEVYDELRVLVTGGSMSGVAASRAFFMLQRK